MNADAVKSAFPGSLTIENIPRDRRLMMSSFLTAMWGERKGRAAFAVGTDPYIEWTAKACAAVNGKGRYSHKNFEQLFYAWPAECETAITDVQDISNAGNADLYVSPMLRAAKERKKASGAGGRFAWADIDGEMTDQRRDVIASFGAAARIVNSGTGHHLYVELDDWRTPGEVESVNQSLTAALGADAKWSNESLLRPPGTWNLKPRTFLGEIPALVQVVKL